MELRFDTYYPYAQLTEILYDLCKTYPDLLKIESIGKSHEGRDVWCLTATNFLTGNPEDRPAFWCDGNIHATEVSASSALLYLLHKVTSEYKTNPEITRLLDTRTLYIVPRVNPDGAEQFFAEKPKFLRSSTRPYPYDEEPIDGLQLEDVDGDGRVLQMRIPDANGTWKTHPDEPRLLTRREPTETGGTYYRVLWEGTLKNYDGVTQTIPRNKEGLDLNRNFPANWRQEAEQVGAGDFPGSEPEVYNLLKFVSSHSNITGGMTFHTYSGVLLRPYGTQNDDAMPAEDLWTYQKIGQKGTELTGYPSISVFHDFKYHPKEVITGVFDDWMYDHQGVFAWTVEIWSPQRQAGLTEGFDKNTKPGSFRFIEWYREHNVEDDLKMLSWSDTALEGKGFITWYVFDHPQLGKVELGGWDVYHAFRNPPPQFLEKEIAPLTDWVIFHALISPELSLVSLETEKLGEENGKVVTRILAVVENIGWLPTYVTKKALERKACRGVVAELLLSDDSVILNGKIRQEFGQLEGRSYKAPSPYGWHADPTDNRLKLEWVIRSTPGLEAKLEIKHERAGVIRKTITL